MPSYPKSNVASPSNSIHGITCAKSVSNATVLGLDGYNFAIGKMHLIVSKYPMRSELYLRNARVPDLNEYIAWKTVSQAALLRKYTTQQALDAYQQIYRCLSQKGTRDRFSSTPSATAGATMSQIDSPEMDAARILTTLHFHAVAMSGTLHPYDFPLTSIEAPVNEPPSPMFPRPDDLPVPDGADAFLLNPVLEEAQQRWVKGVYKEDRPKEVSGRDANGNRIKMEKTIYIVDGEEFHDIVPQRKRGAFKSRNRHPLKLLRNGCGLIDRSAISAPVNNPRSKKRPLDGGITLEDKFENSLCKRMRSNSSNDMPQSSMLGTGKSMRRSSVASASSRKASSGSNSSGSQLSSKDVENLRAVLDPKSMSLVMGAISSSGQSIMAAPPPKPDTNRPQRSNKTGQNNTQVSAPTTAAGSRGTRRRLPPAPLHLAPSACTTRSRVTPSPLPMTPAATPQHSSAADTTPRKNKYVPTTPNPQRWTAAELYHLNSLARQGLHPRELHPKMTEQFPDKLRSLHAIKDRRDKMARSKELQGKVPDYQTKYRDV